MSERRRRPNLRCRCLPRDVGAYPMAAPTPLTAARRLPSAHRPRSSPTAATLTLQRPMKPALQTLNAGSASPSRWSRLGSCWTTTGCTCCPATARRRGCGTRPSGSRRWGTWSRATRRPSRPGREPRRRQDARWGRRLRRWPRPWPRRACSRPPAHPAAARHGRREPQSRRRRPAGRAARQRCGLRARRTTRAAAGVA